MRKRKLSTGARWRSAAVALLWVCTAATTAAAPSTPAAEGRASTETGVVDGAPFRIDVPAGWNGKLVMLLHGYHSEAPGEGEWPREPFAQAFLDRGYAVAASAYRAAGWVVGDALVDNERLRRRFVRTHGPVTRTYAAGYSMGGLIALATIEKHPDLYDGALSMCGVNASSLEFFEEAVFTALVAVEHYFPDAMALAAGGLADPASPATLDPQRLVAAFNTNADLAVGLAQRLDTPPSSLVGVVWFYYRMLRELQQRAGGHPVDNRKTRYAGFVDDAAFNRGVRRYAADPGAAAWLRKNAPLSGAARDPVVLLTGADDDVVPTAMSTRYAERARKKGVAVVERWSRAPGHCSMDGEEIGSAFDALTSRAEKWDGGN